MKPGDFVFVDPEGRRVRLEVRPVTKDDLDRYINDLLNTDWEKDEAAMMLNPSLRLEDVVQTRMFSATRVFLRYLAEIGGSPLTKLGWMKRKVVAQLLERITWAQEYVNPIRHIMKKLDEFDVKPISAVRAVCDVGGLVRKRKNTLIPTRKGLELCDDSKAGALYRHLFISMFHRLDLGFLHFGQPTPYLQWSVPVILWRLSLVADDWLDMPRLIDETLLPQVQRELAADDFDIGQYVFAGRVLKPLVWFGLLETHGDPEDWRWRVRTAVFRKTPLFDRFLQFWWRPTATPLSVPPDPRFN
ncbi:MAG: hypothetical protein ABIK86_04790 [candidate division WOR-3 bacterium]